MNCCLIGDRVIFVRGETSEEFIQITWVKDCRVGRIVRAPCVEIDQMTRLTRGSALNGHKARILHRRCITRCEKMKVCGKGGQSEQEYWPT